MNKTDAINVHTLLVWLLDFADDDAELPSCERAREAAAELAESALVASGTGICGDEVRENWHWVDDEFDDDPRYIPVETVRAAGERL